MKRGIDFVRDFRTASKLDGIDGRDRLQSGHAHELCLRIEELGDHVVRLGQVARAVAEILLQKGLVTGAELASVTAEAGRSVPGTPAPRRR